jgi:hypothetical protein
VQRILAGIDTNGDDCGVRVARHKISFYWIAPQACSLAGREHGRSIPFSDHLSAPAIGEKVVKSFRYLLTDPR